MKLSKKYISRQKNPLERYCSKGIFAEKILQAKIKMMLSSW